LSRSVWIETKLGNQTFHLLNLDHPDIEDAIVSEIDSGVDVYYDQRWNVTEKFCQFLVDQPEWVIDRSVLVLGTGIGMETLLIGRLCQKIYLNDLALIALDLCARQLRKNGINNFELLPGRYEGIDIPPVDIVIGCYLVYNQETIKAMRQFLKSCSSPVILMDEPNTSFQRFVRATNRKTRHLLSESEFSCILFE